MSRRSQARAIAVQLLYQHDLNPDAEAAAAWDYINERVDDEATREFSRRLFTGALECRADLDRRIEAAAENWTLSRMAVTDRNVIRLAAYEMLHTETPARVVIDEALELAKRYGNAQSPQFVNGILDKLIPEDQRPELTS